LVLKENIAGFCRNLWGRKAYVVVLVARVALLLSAAVGHEVVTWEDSAFAAAFAVAALVVWVTMITPEWVQEAADAYATRLIESAFPIPPQSSVE
jgi:hypothetical protein